MTRRGDQGPVGRALVGGLVCLAIIAACSRAGKSNAERGSEPIVPNLGPPATDALEVQFTEGLRLWRSASAAGDEISRATAMKLMNDAIEARQRTAPGSWHADFGRVLFEEESYGDARRHLTAALEDKALSNRASAIALLAECQGELGNFTEALALVSLARRLSPEACSPARAEVNVHRLRRDLPAAVAAAIDFTKWRCTAPPDILALALLAEEMGRLGEAKSLLFEVLRLDVCGPWARRAAAILETLDPLYDEGRSPCSLSPSSPQTRIVPTPSLDERASAIWHSAQKTGNEATYSNAERALVAEIESASNEGERFEKTHALALLRCERSRCEETLRMLQKIADRSADKALRSDVLADRAFVLWLEGKHELALADADIASALSRTCKARLSRALALLGLEREREAFDEAPLKPAPAWDKSPGLADDCAPWLKPRMSLFLGVVELRKGNAHAARARFRAVEHETPFSLESRAARYLFQIRPTD